MVARPWHRTGSGSTKAGPPTPRPSTSSTWAGGDEQAFLDYLRQIHQTYLAWDSQFLPIYDPPVNDLFNTSQYEKAASVLHMLRDLMGDAAFLQAQRDWQAVHRYGTAAATPPTRA